MLYVKLLCYQMTKIMFIYLAKVCINECFNVLASIETGAYCSAISLQTVYKLR